MKAAIRDRRNFHIHCYTPTLLTYMQKADLSISMPGHNTTMNILSTGVESMMPFAGSGDQAQTMRVGRLAQLGRVRQIQQDELLPARLAEAMLEQLQHFPDNLTINLNGQTVRLISTVRQYGC